MDIKELNLTDEQMALVSKYVQSETDKVRTDYSAKLKTANDEIARLKPVEKSDAEKALEERISALESKGITREDFKKMGYAERAKLYAENPSLYQALNK